MEEFNLIVPCGRGGGNATAFLAFFLRFFIFHNLRFLAFFSVFLGDFWGKNATSADFGPKIRFAGGAGSNPRVKIFSPKILSFTANKVYFQNRWVPKCPKKHVFRIYFDTRGALETSEKFFGFLAFFSVFSVF